jgi:hypothetical protein
LYFEPLKAGASHIILTIEAVDAIISAGSGCEAQPQDQNCIPRPLIYPVHADELMTVGEIVPVGQTQALPNFHDGTLTLDQIEITENDLLANWRYSLPPAMRLLGVSAKSIRFSAGRILGCGGVSHSGVQVNDSLQERYYRGDVSPGTEYTLACALGSRDLWPVGLGWEIPD